METPNSDSVMFMLGSSVSAILRDLNEPTARHFFYLSAKIVRASRSWFWWVKGSGKGVVVDNGETRIDNSPHPPNPIALNLEMDAARACLSFSNLTLI